MSPYFGRDFFSFFPLFFSRLWQLITGSLSISELAPDEIQVFVLSLVCISSALVGSLLVLKKMTMLANSLSHTILLGIVAAAILFSYKGDMVFDLKIMMVAALISGLLTIFLTEFLHKTLQLQEDASIALVFSTLFALGIVLVTLYTRNTHIGVEVIMGNADALHIRDLDLALWTAACNTVLVTLFYKEWKLMCFDPSLGKSMGFRPQLFQTGLMLLTSFTVISSFRAVGVLLFLAFMVGLPLSARMLTHSLKRLIFWAIGIGVICSLFSVAICRNLLTTLNMPLSTGGMTVSLIGIAFAVAVVVKYWFLKPFRP
jgi:manganese/zinc/iron transport system permease protein